jgi:hypothetical protein
MKSIIISVLLIIFVGVIFFVFIKNSSAKHITHEEEIKKHLSFFNSMDDLNEKTHEHLLELCKAGENTLQYLAPILGSNQQMFEKLSVLDAIVAIIIEYQTGGEYPKVKGSNAQAIFGPIPNLLKKYPLSIATSYYIFCLLSPEEESTIYSDTVKFYAARELYALPNGYGRKIIFKIIGCNNDELKRLLRKALSDVKDKEIIEKLRE